MTKIYLQGGRNINKIEIPKLFLNFAREGEVRKNIRYS